MGKYSNTTLRPSSLSKPKGPHAIWRGIGCLMIMVIPAMSIAIGSGMIDYGIDHKWPIPYQLRAPLILPDIFYSTPGLRTIFNPISNISDFYAIAAASLLFMMLLSGLISTVYALVFRIVGPKRYGPTDAPPENIKVTKKSR